MGNYFPHTVGKPVDEIDSNTTRHDGVNGTSMTGLLAIEVEIYSCARSSKSIMVEQHDRTSTSGNPTPTQQSNTLNLPSCIVQLKEYHWIRLIVVFSVIDATKSTKRVPSWCILSSCHSVPSSLTASLTSCRREFVMSCRSVSAR
jgi:hypothetical protein